ncbi:MAG: hypothetical protein ACK40R_04905 [Thermomonas sp.]
MSQTYRRSARPRAARPIASRAAGFDAFLRKPVTGAMLARALGSVLAARVPPA